MDPKAQVTVLADSYQGKRLNSPNDLAYKSNGEPSTLPIHLMGSPRRTKIRPSNYRSTASTGYQERFLKSLAPLRTEAQLQLLVKDLPRPNGICFSPDEKYLYVNNSEPKKLWMRYTVQADGTLTEGKVFFDATSDTPARSARRPEGR